MAIPFLLLPWLSSGSTRLAGMINATTPLFHLLMGALLIHPCPRVASAGPCSASSGSWRSASRPSRAARTLLGVALVLCAATLTASRQIAAPAQASTARCGSRAARWSRLPGAGARPRSSGVSDSSFGWSSLLAVVALGALGTGVAFIWFTG